jgi:hypothetical protein
MDDYSYFSNYLQYDSYLDNIKMSRADRQPCPVCGHPTGDCSSGEAPVRIISFDPKSVLTGPTHYVEKDIWEEKQITPYTKSTVLVYKRGTRISQEEAERLGLL